MGLNEESIQCEGLVVFGIDMGEVAEADCGSQLRPIATEVLVDEADVEDRARHIPGHRDYVCPKQKIRRAVPVRTKVYLDSVVLEVRWRGGASARWLAEGFVKRCGAPVASQLGHKTIGSFLFKWLIGKFTICGFD